MIETLRLRIVPLNSKQLSMYLQGQGKFENTFDLIQAPRKVNPAVKKRVRQTILPIISQPEISGRYLYYTFWIVIDKVHRIIVAELGFKGEPNDLGEIEIGYGTLIPHRKQGYMTEAVGGMVRWASVQAGVQYVVAETDKVNIDSIHILVNNGFIQFAQKGEMQWWRIAVK